MTSDEDAFRRWAAERQLGLLRTAVLVSGDPHRAEDLVQEALTKVALRWRRLQHGNPEAYAHRIIVNDNILAWRKRRREVLVDATPEEVGGGASAADQASWPRRCGA